MLLPHLLADIVEGFAMPPKVFVRLFGEAAPSASRVFPVHAAQHGVGPHTVHENASHESALFSGEVLESGQSARPVRPLESLQLGSAFLDSPGLQPGIKLEHDRLQMLVRAFQHVNNT
eukprot:10374429-Alexandrium_andersonii.AAC.1